jgi:hypothetical protein
MKAMKMRRERGVTTYANRVRLIGAILLTTAACSESTPPAKNPAGQAAFMERTRCGPADDEATIAPIIGGAAVQSVQPLYSDVENMKAGLQHELRGVTISVAALPGVTAEWLDRALECHSARATLGHAPAASNDPFWLMGSMVDIEVRSAKDGFLIDVIGFSSQDAQQILSRAAAFQKK